MMYDSIPMINKISIFKQKWLKILNNNYKKNVSYFTELF